MAISNYAELQTAVGAWMNRADLASRIPEFIANAEAEFNRTLRLPDMIRIQTAFFATSRYTPLPADFLQMERLVLLSGASRDPLRYIGGDADAEIEDGAPGMPRAYSIRGTSLELLPVPTQSEQLEVSYWARIPSLSTMATNFLLSASPDLYLYRSCLEGALYMQDEKRAVYFQGLYDRVLQQVQESGKAKRYGPAMRVQVV